MEFEVSYSLDNEQQFWDELDEIVSAHCQSHALIDNALRSYLSFTTNYKDEYLQSEYDIARCSYKLLRSNLFQTHKEYVRRQIVYGLLQEDDANMLHVITSFLLFDGQQDEKTFEMMSQEGAFPRLLELAKNANLNEDTGLHRMLLELLYEMSRIQRLRPDELMLVDDHFISYLFQIIEELANDVNDPYHGPVIKVLLVLNEQYMLSAHDPQASDIHGVLLTNRVIKVLSLRGGCFKTFGENLILLLNRESETSLQLLILKLLYLLFTTRTTYEYFYTNDLYVLVDVIIRNILDLPEESSALRHTYLRVLHPLLAHTQLRDPPHYKRQEILRLLSILTTRRSAHFAPIDDTTARLVGRVASVSWLANETRDSGEVARRLLRIHEGPAGESSLSVAEVASQQEKPGVLTPSRDPTAKGRAASKEEEIIIASEHGIVHSTEAVSAGKSPFEVEGEISA
ncbi:hypothetical protein L228DRAFT_262045 [Xylona heveae TC161]|uniref:SPIN90/Ldb17 leucine-rich domain-containing protein n=1 Tax=Xylona heveae (strain CBS 132557 / TC161) TaxID=1328760 RepID=A0A165GA48_XYLHT|nr:hypothetical protein L228DRAFT_262045 [Xylona heveae TC161]KZF21937.1 hypothetical protein L228DRAFT_262045 [Xylona heveae TC161]